MSHHSLKEMLYMPSFPFQCVWLFEKCGGGGWGGRSDVTFEPTVRHVVAPSEESRKCKTAKSCLSRLPALHIYRITHTHSHTHTAYRTLFRPNMSPKSENWKLYLSLSECNMSLNPCVVLKDCMVTDCAIIYYNLIVFNPHTVCLWAGCCFSQCCCGSCRAATQNNKIMWANIQISGRLPIFNLPDEANMY